MTRRTVRELHHLQQLVEAGPDLRDTVCQGFTIPAGAVRWDTAEVAGLIMLGCIFEDPAELQQARDRGALLFPRLHDHAIDDGLDDLLGGRDRHTLVAVMGGTSGAATIRGSPWWPGPRRP